MGGKGVGGVACSQSVTEIERLHERERDTGTERESTKAGEMGSER